MASLGGDHRDNDLLEASPRVGADAQEALIAMEPEVYFITPHYAGSWAVLVRLDALEEAAMQSLIAEAWQTNAPKRLLAEYDAEKQ